MNFQAMHKVSGLRLSGAVLIATLAASFSPQAADERKALRVCADGNYMPFSNQKRDGFENRIAKLLATDLNVPLEYTWFPQRMGFIRNTLRAEDPVKGGYKCDLVMGVPHRYELAVTTDPYYRSTYALVYVKGRGLDDIDTPKELIDLPRNRREQLRIGVNERSPGAQWLAKYGFLEQLVPYVAQVGDPAVGPGELEGNDLLAGKIDMAILWGPIAGYLAVRAQEQEVRVIPLASEPDIKFHYAISAGVRRGEKAWKAELDELLTRNADKIAAVLREYNVPLVSEQGRLVVHAR